MVETFDRQWTRNWSSLPRGRPRILTNNSITFHALSQQSSQKVQFGDMKTYQFCHAYQFTKRLWKTLVAKSYGKSQKCMHPAKFKQKSSWNTFRRGTSYNWENVKRVDLFQSKLTLSTTNAPNKKVDNVRLGLMLCNGNFMSFFPQMLLLSFGTRFRAKRDRKTHTTPCSLQAHRN